MQGLFLLFSSIFLLSLSKGEQLQFQLHYAVRENEPSGHRVGYLDEDLRRQQSLNFSQLCGGGGGCKDLRFRLREPSFHLELDETTALLTTKSIIDFEQLCIGQCRSTLDAYLSVTVNVWQERKLTAFIHVRIQVIDVDDNSVEFPGDIPRPFILCLKEVIYRKGKTIELPRAVDRDVTPKFSSITYRLEFATSQWASMKMVELSVTNDSRPLLVLKEDLDYEDVKEYGFSLVACNPSLQADSPKTVVQEAQLSVVIQVLNINDMEPVFPQSVYTVEVPEDIQPGMVIIELKAIDRDADAVLTYSINSAPGMNLSTPFEVEPDGKVRLRERFDFEQCTDYNLPIRASDGDFTASTRLHIHLLDINDEAPTFIVNPTHLTVEENQPPNIIIGQVVVRDADTFAVNGYLECAEPPEDAERQPLRFERRVESVQSTLESTAVPELHFDLYTRHSLDREEGAAVRLARLVCWDGGGGDSGAEADEVLYGDRSTATAGRSVSLTSTLTISIHVQDKNDNAPIFTQSTFAADLEENNGIRKEILQLTSKDYDTEENAITRYRLTDENADASLFYLNEDTGHLYAMAHFDRETRDTYHLQVVAYDASQNPLEIPGTDHQSISTAMVIVRITDVNDHAPLIQETGELILPENKEPDFLVGQVVATDLDTGVNGEVTFDIVPTDPRAVFNGPQHTQVIGFRMTPNGSIFSTRQFDRETQSRYCFQVQAKDKSSEASLSSTARVCVNILDVNDNSPIIHSIEGPDARYERDSLVQTPPLVGMETIETQYSLASHELPSLRISMNEAPGYCALLIQAVDLDEGENAELRYSLKLAANCTPPSMPTSRFGHNLEKERKENAEREFRQFSPHTFRIDERTGKLLLVRRLSDKELGSYCLGLVVEDQGHPPLKSIQLIELVIEDVPSRGNWLGAGGDGKNSLNHGSFATSYRIEAKNILIVIVLSTVSAFLAAVLISAILCMVRPFHKSRRRRSGDAVLNDGVGCGGTMKLSPFGMEPHTSPTLLMNPRSGALSCSDSATLDGCSAVGEGTWIVGTTGTLISAYDGNEMKSGAFRLQADGMAPIWSPMHMASSDCTFETESLIPIGLPSEIAGNPISSGSTLQRGQHFLLHQSPALGCPLSRGPTVEMVAVSCGQDEQRSDSGRGASDEEAMFQGPFQSILCGCPVASTGKVSGSVTLAADHPGFVGTLPRLETSETPVTPITTTSGIYLCASSLAGQTGTVSTTSAAEERPQRSVSTFVTSEEKENGSLPCSEVPLTLVGNISKTFSLPREGLCMTKSLLDDHTADESANRLCQEIDHLLFDNMI
uniref:Protocadherin gamma c4 n=1 Tax=Echinococcus granulosus TaxID=6210 RepID=A0A068WBV3_ECHGR|nr:protocadherin gamma c4 [Echinococcus granulosus]